MRRPRGGVRPWSEQKRKTAYNGRMNKQIGSRLGLAHVHDVLKQVCEQALSIEQACLPWVAASTCAAIPYVVVVLCRHTIYCGCIKAVYNMLYALTLAPTQALRPCARVIDFSYVA